MLYAHQEKFLKENPNKSALVWSCGTGKTRTAIEWASELGKSTLIICPKALKVNWWREIEKYGGRTMKNVLTKEEFRRDYKIIPRYDAIIVDEVHNGFLTPMFKSQMSKALRWYLKTHEVERVLLLSATVYTSSPWNIYNLGHYLGYEWSWPRFKFEFFNEVPMGRRTILVAKENAPERLAQLVKVFASVVDIRDVLDVPLQNHLEPEYFALTKGQEKAIKDAYDPLPIVRYTLQHEIENGILIGNEYKEDEFYEIDKMDRIKALCEENKKVAIVCRYNLQIYALAKLIQDKLGFLPTIINGETINRDAATLTSESAERAIVLIQADCAEGYQLPSFELCIFASQSYSYTKWEQICGRFLRMDKPSRTTFVYLLTEGESVDQGVYDAVKKKQDFKIELFKK